MCRWPLTIVSMAALMASVAAQDHPQVSLAFPLGIASETIQINYYLTGPFGGYGGFVRPDKQRVSYDIDPFVDGRPAENIKIIAYLPGCEITTLDLAFSGTAVERRLDCAPLGTISLRGQVLPALITQDQSREIEVSYLAMWSHRFFGIYDGLVTTIRLGAVRVDQNGDFEITLPDLYKQPILRDGGIQFILREPKTKNIIAFLRPAETTPKSRPWLTVQASYRFVQLVPVSNPEPENSK
jgi:hypothetical protein